MGTVGLVLEGGGSRGLYTNGVLDVFVEQGITFPYGVGVSAGACNGVSYLAGQKKRYYRVLTGYSRDSRYMGVKNFLKTGYAMDNDFVFGELSYALEPVDVKGYDRYLAGGGRFLAGATDCITGQPDYFPIRDLRRDGVLINASSSLPLICPMVKVGQRLYLDGGISDPVPIGKAMADGYNRCVVILTRDRTYRKATDPTLELCRLRYRKFPRLLETMERRHLAYNECMERMNGLEQLGNVLVIRPEMPVKIRRMEKDLTKMDALYHIGRADGERYAQAVREFQKNS